ncbi:hypothetical protein PTNB73_09636 [Pyrenophora teres f. teres]|nr:hypothetical protein HRS9139_10184 [Pyrenophora teres f. teres]KAE8826028.1 hypothetical protein PTNB85_08973 [Pyrenophora teres f. teres]KAE8852913.1 hypothetical protein PTNB29_10303 [Pyrenophora teres f. teres]KAE8856371.1 hypothetical protein PTNB73_09636 [Pyrenophora teres f. teres]
MRDEKSIILAVVVADNDPENQKVFRYLKDFDSTGSRTLGIITKPDKVERGGDNEKEMMGLVKNQKLPLKHRWHAVRNRSYATKDQTPAEQLVTAVQSSIQTTEAGLKALGPVRDTAGQQRAYLTGHAQKFHMLTNDALGGIYNNPLFALSSPDEPATTRLRTEIQNLNMAFAQTMYVKGHNWNIVSTYGSSAPVSSDGYSQAFLEYNNEFNEPEFISREDLNSHIGKYVRQSRPSGLPLLINPRVIGDVFQEQSQHWREHAKHHLQRVFKAMTSYVEEALGSLMDPYTCSMLMLKQVRPELDRRWRSVEAKLEELLMPYTEQDPITKTKARASGSASASVPFVFGTGDDGQKYTQSAQHLLTESIDNYTNSETLDLMPTYYKASTPIFISNIAILGIENCLIKDLPAIFSPTLIAGMDEEKLSAIASESEEIRHERATLEQKLSVLEPGKQVLFEHIAMRPTTRTTTKPATSSIRPSMAPSRSHKPNSRQDEQKRRDVKQDSDDELSCQLDNLVVTPPSPVSAPVRSRPRVDSGTATPTPKKQSRRRSPFGWPPSYEVPRAAVEDASDDD